MDTKAAVEELSRSLEALASPERALQEKRYLKSDLEHLGVTVPAITRTTGHWWARIDGRRDDALRLVEALWAPGIHELRMAAVKLLESSADLLEPQDIDLIENLIRRSRTWAYVDELAAAVSGPLLERHPAADEILDRWARDENFWVRRSALLAHLVALRGGGGDWDRFTRYADAMLGEKEFFIRKAIGWVLRDTARKRPDMVYAWILPRTPRASGVTVREAVKRLSPAQAEAVMTAYRSS
jgi:3-methyladenine DNA glycosylase AlkD